MHSKKINWFLELFNEYKKRFFAPLKGAFYIDVNSWFDGSDVTSWFSFHNTLCDVLGNVTYIFLVNLSRALEPLMKYLDTNWFRGTLLDCTIYIASMYTMQMYSFLLFEFSWSWYNNFIPFHSFNYMYMSISQVNLNIR